MSWFRHHVAVWSWHDVLCLWPQFPYPTMKRLTKDLPLLTDLVLGEGVGFGLAHAAKMITTGQMQVTVVNQGYLSSFQDAGGWGG